ncbi:DUF6922 domain-containing protein [Elizabethkingia anophelis]|uniref:DUF6922 domain-containing protein n=1 Tax=Elizabethkingia anophelis TaxID=1117645 RepID=UPI0004CF4361
MNNRVNIATIFPKYFFWDMDYTKLNVQDDKDIIIPRAMYATTFDSFEEDIQRLEFLYTPQEIINYLKNTKELISNEVCFLVSKRYNIELFTRFSRV